MRWLVAGELVAGKFVLPTALLALASRRMDWQQLAALAIVGIAAFLLIRSRLRPRGNCLSKDSPCGCSAATGPAPKGSITYRARKGERSQVIVKMG